MLNESIRKSYAFVIAIVMVLSYSVYLIPDPAVVAKLGSEDNIVEWMTTVCFFMTFLFFIIIFLKTRNVWFLMLGIIFFLGAGEEISWGQRVLSFQTPEKLNELNVQKEFNFHNLEIFNTEYQTGHVKTGIMRLLEINFLYKVFSIIYGIVLPVSVFRLRFISRFVKSLHIPVPPVSLGVFFLINWIIFRLMLNLVLKQDQVFQYYDTDTEIFEFVSSFIFLFISLYFFRKPGNEKLI
jgi:hypothetical protein